MKIKAVIFDVYGTLLEVLPPPADADVRWERLWRRYFKARPRLGRSEFGAACERIIAREHTAARARGIPYPEVCWPAIVREALPETGALTSAKLADFLFAQAQIWHTVRMGEGAAAVLKQLRCLKLPLGIASNAQDYTLRELQAALEVHSLTLSLFEPDLCFWSFEHGFSKPDPHVFRILTARLVARSIAPGQTLMVGDHLDNDIGPARAHGLQTWLRATTEDPDWEALHRRLQESSQSVPTELQ